MQPVTYVTYYALAPFHESGHYLRETKAAGNNATPVFDLVHPLTGKPAQALLTAYYKSN